MTTISNAYKTSKNTAGGIKKVLSGVLLVTALFSMTDAAIAGTGVSINGYPLNSSELLNLERQLGVAIPAGQYAVNMYSGCWMNLSTGAAGCPQNTYVGRGGSGERNAAGDWSYYSNAAGFGVGGTGDGCLYAGDWSNC